MIDFYSPKFRACSLMLLFFVMVFSYVMTRHMSIAHTLDISCKSKGVWVINDYTFRFVNSFVLNSDGSGASAFSGKVVDSQGGTSKIGIQIYFDYSFESGMLDLRTNHIVKQVDNTASDQIIQSILPSIYSFKDGKHKIAIFKVGSGYRLDYNTYPGNYCY